MSHTLERVTASAPAKTNLVLHVGTPTPDGYHPLETLFLAVDLRETVAVSAGRPGSGTTVTVEPAPGSGYARMVESGAARLADIPLDATNLAVRAARAVCEARGVAAADLALRIGKAVPVAGGMGGGSADAAAALVAVDALLARESGTAASSAAELARLGAGLGADVPFMLLGGAAIGRGTGTELEPVAAADALHLVFVPQDRGLSTPAVYRAWDTAHKVGLPGADAHGVEADADDATFGAQSVGTAAGPDPVPAGALAALAAGDPHALATRIRNDLQAPAVELLPALRAVLALGTSRGALSGWVSGSGPTVCFLADSADAAARLAAELTGEGHHALAVTGPVPGARVETDGCTRGGDRA
ncbi:4-(cytidine 5'-diphospho)-2-C-methyl-D-erythritol kinase [Kocuria sp.]|uniref:4-(cytidine 5'-diphospho)-2-C-methyl-D-erythritol kinase n=1 Tax=Kocuria sp. TaxID=1871328 RepID=UPI0026DBB1B8|nr:4-(cytidine 5'-diphospho)-2-C-methyl-D-erythritol kinase [Kocuria sp.]MDO4919625.1 4-(cytidine 5'-diphospho)-2-C-methyl-D-erythritol kinase [Kocuria sp.]